MINSQFDVKDQSLKEIVSFLPNLITHSRASNTTKKYNCYFNQWENWCCNFQEINPLPTRAQYIILFIVASFQNGRSFTAIDAAVSAIKYFHSLINVHFSDNSMMKHVLEAVKRILNHVTQKN